MSLDLVNAHSCSDQYFLLQSNGASIIRLIFFYIEREVKRELIVMLGIITRSS